jgi:hypothetical protein
VTVDHGILIADDCLTELGLYVGLTRGRHANHALVVTEPREEHIARTAPVPTAKEILADVLKRDTAERSASETLRSMLEPQSYQRLTAELEHVVKTITRTAGPNGSTQEAWLKDHEGIADLYSLIRATLENHPARDSRWEPQPPRHASEPEPDLGPGLEW